MIDSDQLQLLKDGQETALKQSIISFASYMQYSSLDSSLAIPGKADYIFLSLQKLYNSVYNKKLK